MRKLLTKVSSKVNRVALGEVTDTKSKESIPLNCLVPFAAASEDFEIILKNNQLLPNNLPIEMNGFNSHLNMKKAVSIGGEKGNTEAFYINFTQNHPILLSFPSEVIWLGPDKGIDRLTDSFKWTARRSDLGIEPQSIENYSAALREAITKNTKTYGFWTSITAEDRKLSRILLESTLNMATLTRSTFLSGITPLLTKSSTKSGILSQRFNLAYGAMITDYEDIGEKCPKYLYTINLDSSIIPKDNYSDDLKDIPARARATLETNQFDGIFVSIRGLKYLSDSEGRVNTLKKLYENLCDVSADEKLPIWFSRTGVISLALFELGASYGSYKLNNTVDDIYLTGFKQNVKTIDPKITCGKVLDPDSCRILDYNQVFRLKDGLPRLDDVPNRPNDYMSNIVYRKTFAKPYTIAAMNHLNKKWIENINSGETTPGAEYLARFTEPNYIGNWGK